jgi:hypothetical protein
MRLSICLALALTVAGLTAPVARALPPRDIAGVAVHPWQMTDPITLERTFAGIEGTGARWARVDLSWNFVERHGPAVARGAGNWTAMDAIAQAAARHGIELLPMVAYTPPWASSEREMWSFPDSQAFEDFFAAALRRYPQIRAWEIWNEPNLHVFARPRPDPVGFVELLRAARRARDRVGSGANLIAGGLAPGGEIAIGPWLDTVARLGGLRLVDGVGIHPYSVRDPADPGSWMMRLEALHRRLSELAGRDMPLWLTEYGAPNIPFANGYGPALTGQQQARRLRVAFSLAARWRWVKNLTWYEYRDSCADVANADCNFGLVRSDFSPRPAYGALREVVAGATMKLRPRLVLRVRRARGVSLRGTLTRRLAGLSPGRRTAPRAYRRMAIRPAVESSSLLW